VPQLGRETPSSSLDWFFSSLSSRFRLDVALLLAFLSGIDECVFALHLEFQLIYTLSHVQELIPEPELAFQGRHTLS